MGSNSVNSLPTTSENNKNFVTNSSKNSVSFPEIMVQNHYNSSDLIKPALYTGKKLTFELIDLEFRTPFDKTCFNSFNQLNYIFAPLNSVMINAVRDMIVSNSLNNDIFYDNKLSAESYQMTVKESLKREMPNNSNFYGPFDYFTLEEKLESKLDPYFCCLTQNIAIGINLFSSTNISISNSLIREYNITHIVDCSGSNLIIKNVSDVTIFSFATFLKKYPKNNPKFSMTESFFLAVETCLAYIKSCIEKGGKVLITSAQTALGSESKALSLVSFFLVRFYSLTDLDIVFFMRKKCPTMNISFEIFKLLATYSSLIKQSKSLSCKPTPSVSRMHRCLCGSCNVILKAAKNISTFTNVANLEFSLQQIYNLYGIEMNSIQWEMSNIENIKKCNLENAIEVENVDFAEENNRNSISKGSDYKLYQCKYCYFPVFAISCSREESFSSESKNPILIVNDSPLSDDWFNFNDIRPVLFQVICQKI